MVADKINKIKKWIKENKFEFWSIAAVVAVSLFLRLFRISSYMTFLGDEGRDALVWLRMTHGKFTLIGPTTSIGNMYLGPLYYYLMLPFYILLGTVGPSVGVALFAGTTTFLLWLFGRQWFSEKVGLLSAFLYAISPVAIILSRSSWNPNVMPFFALLTIWGVWQFWQKSRYWWLFLVGITLSFAVQSHYLGLLLAGGVFIFWIIKFIGLFKTKNLPAGRQGKDLPRFLLMSGLCVLVFVSLTILPLVWFDLRHNFINYQSFYKFFSERQTTVNLKPYKAIPQVWPLWQNLVTRLLTGKDEKAGLWIALVFALGTVTLTASVLRKEKNKKNPALVLTVVFLLTGLLGMGLYKQDIYDHYFGFLFPVIFLLAGIILEKVWLLYKVGKIVSILLFIFLVTLSVVESPLKYSPNNQMNRTAVVDKKIIDESMGKPFNLGMIAKQNYDAGYRYFLEKWGKKAVDIDAQKIKETITEQLFVVCEDKECQPLGHPQAEIANFGWSKISDQWEFPWGTKLFKLIRF